MGAWRISLDLASEAISPLQSRNCRSQLRLKSPGENWAPENFLRASPKLQARPSQPQGPNAPPGSPVPGTAPPLPHGARGSYSAARASAALPSGGILRVTNTFMSSTGLIRPAAADSDLAGRNLTLEWTWTGAGPGWSGREKRRATCAGGCGFACGSARLRLGCDCACSGADSHSDPTQCPCVWGGGRGCVPRATGESGPRGRGAVSSPRLHGTPGFCTRSGTCFHRLRP